MVVIYDKHGTFRTNRMKVYAFIYNQKVIFRHFERNHDYIAFLKEDLLKSVFLDSYLHRGPR